MRPRSHHEPDVELEGPTEFTLTPPPRRRVSVIVVSLFSLLVILSLAGLAFANPGLFVSAVQAFVGGI